MNKKITEILNRLQEREATSVNCPEHLGRSRLLGCPKCQLDMLEGFKSLAKLNIWLQSWRNDMLKALHEESKSGKDFHHVSMIVLGAHLDLFFKKPPTEDMIIKELEDSVTSTTLIGAIALVRAGAYHSVGVVVED